jgi:hypothetical protein
MEITFCREMHASLFEGFYLAREVFFVDLSGDTILYSNIYKPPNS